jgi:site-specific DNA recombinase
MKAAIYCRVSTARQAAEDKVSMEDQEERCRAVAEMKGWQVTALFDEGDASAGTAQRAEFQKMVTAARAGEFDVIIAREISRLSRIPTATLELDQLMVHWGIRICDARSGYVYGENDDIGAGLLWKVENALAIRERAEKSFRTKMGAQGKAEKGFVPGSKAPYGYRWESGKIAIDEDRATVVRRIFSEAAEGSRMTTIAERLNQDGIPSPGEQPRGWCRSSVQTILTRGAYYGEHVYGLISWLKLDSDRARQEWTKASFERTGRMPDHIPSRVKQPGERVWTVYTPALVDKALFDKAKGRIQRATRQHRPEIMRRPMLLLGLARCEECAQPLKATWGRGRNDVVHHYYYCVQRCRATDRKAGVSRLIAAEDIESRVWGLVSGMLSDPATLAAAVGAKMEQDDVLGPGQDQRIERHRAHLEKAERAFDVARRLFYAGDVDERSYQRDKDHYEREIASLRDELARMEEAAAQRFAEKTTLAAVTRIADQWKLVEAEITDQGRQKLIWELVKDVTVTKGNLVTVSGLLSVREEGGLVGGTGLEPVTSSV